MQNKSRVDYLIVGQGIAGTILAFQLIKKKKKVIIIDKYDENSSSRVAAGLFNPITGRKYVKTWHADLLFNYLHSFYEEFEQYLGTKFFNKCDIFRPFENTGEQNDWDAKSHQKEFIDYVKVIHNPNEYPTIKNPHGGLLLRKGGFVDVVKMLDAARKNFAANGILVDEYFDAATVSFDNDKIIYKNFIADKIIMCLGSSENQDGWFSWLPFRRVKGEVLHVKSNEEINLIFNKGCFITPAIKGLNRVGSTYDWKDLTTLPTETGKDTILSRLNALLNWHVQVEDQKAGIRPATLDRKPFIGIHPEFKTIGIFNGLGTKGVTLAPYFSDQFVEYLEDGLKLDIDVDIKRYYSLYYNSYSS